MTWKQYIASLSWLNVRITEEQFYQWCEPDYEGQFEQLQIEVRALQRFRDKNNGLTWQESVQGQLQWLHEQKVSTCLFGDPDYPEALSQCSYPPLLITYWGQPAWLKRPCLSVVGSRKPTVESQQWMEMHFSEFLKQRDFNIVSGGARGIDQLAHRLSLSHQRATICFLPSGLKPIYPQSLQTWVPYIVESGGCVLSVFAPFAKMQKSYFHYRNQWIAQMSQMTFVVEANRRSGSYLTAQKALQLGKEIVTLPCSPMSQQSQGNLDLIYDGAHMVRDAQDLLSLVY